MTAPAGALVGILGGSGFYSLAEGLRSVEIDTPYGPPAAALRLGRFAGRDVAFLARHGEDHEYPAHRVPYRANLWALRSVGVSTLLAPFSCGSLQRHIAPGDFVVCDQIVDRTQGRSQTYYDGPETHHVTFADPYCPALRGAAVEAARAEGISVHDGGTVVVIQGPRFSTRAESAWFGALGGDIVNMTQVPEAPLAAELGMCFAGIALVTDYDAGVIGDTGAEPVSHEQVLAVFNQNLARVRRLIGRLVGDLAAARPACCGDRAGPPLSPDIPAQRR
ncbi:MAG: S-methyl-5'-thioadenosine phosphorylase [bacterium]|nr:S-methyl-5'-thioadenosine phosphorylase [bacterium]